MNALLTLSPLLLEQEEHLPERLGGKAYQQLLALADGMPVLDALVVTTDCYPGHDRVREFAASADELIRDWLSKCGVDLTTAIEARGWPLVAVRSSATVEDQATASFAGSFVTRLGVRARDVYRAVYDVWASASTARVEKYMEDRGIGRDFAAVKMAVLIQPLVSAPLLAGVAVSHPLGRPDATCMQISVVRGLGSALVEGTVTPETYLIERGTWAVIAEAEARSSALIYEFSGEIGRCVEELEISRNTPQDLEFAIDREKGFVLLQNRPIVPSMARRKA